MELVLHRLQGRIMTDFTDQEAFKEFDRSPMVPCTAPTAADFSDNDTLIWCNIAGEMRLYSYDGVKVEYQVVQLGPKT